MIHTVHLDDRYINIKALLQDIHQQKQGVHFESPFSFNNDTLEEYMTDQEFWAEADKRIIKVCKQYGILQ